MKSEEANNKNSENFVWQNGVAVSNLKPSNEDMKAERKQIIQMALHYRIQDIRTYSGYKGDLIVEISSSNIGELERLKESAQMLNMEAVIKPDPILNMHKIYCITGDEEIYGLKS